MYLFLQAKQVCLHPAKYIQLKRHQLLLTNRLRTVWRQYKNPTTSCFLCLAPPPLCLATSCAYSLHAGLVCLSFFLKTSVLLLSLVDDFCKDCNIWQDLPMFSSTSIFFVFFFLEDTAYLWGFLPIFQLLPFLHSYPLALFCWAFQSYWFLFTLKPMTLHPITVP